ncbi:hypothetical protein M9H77_34768 [Catharanthus roseus]|uniref:Uncharacterized protein n=1 Tax=Catharanthus roseus TaxID=4058 RepID=A0ACB9ZMU5_CATRO|nr:hypothetical protein M9H77_34768 [Catharanthus roseus]
MAGTVDGEQKVLAAAQQIVKSLNSSKNVNTDDMILLFSTIDTRLSNFSDLMLTSSTASAGAPVSSSSFVFSSPSGVGFGAVDDSSSSRASMDPRFQAAEQLILRWDSNGGGLDGDFSNEDYLAAVDEIIQLTEDLSVEPSSSVDGGTVEGDVMDRAENALQLAMSRLEDEFRHILIRNTAPLDPDRLHGSMIRLSSLSTSNSGEGISEIPDFDSATMGSGTTSFGDHDDTSSGRYNRHLRGPSISGDEVALDLIHPDAILELKEIADRMIRAGYEKECCQVYSSVRRDVFDECMSILGVEKFSIEEVQRIEWKSLDEKMKKWITAVKIVVRILLTAEKSLCEEIFAGSDLIKEVCFIETAKGCVMQLLNFGEAVAIAKRSSEKLFRILDMYDALSNVLPDLQGLFNDEEAGEMICSEAKGVLDGLGVAAIGTLVEFESAVQGETSRRPIQNGEIHPLTRYVMNYVKLLVDYSGTLNVLLENMKETSETENSKVNERDNTELESSSPVALRMLSLIKSLESNLEEKSRMYEDGGLQYVFLMNNILYIVQKIKDSELRNLLGDNWIRRRRGQIRQYATSYLRASWSKVLSCLKDEGIGGGSSNASKVVLKDRFKNFNACFEDIYRIQTAWKVPDAQLRDELRISISEKLIPAYRSFMGRFGSHLESGRNAGKYIKYTSEDLENYLSHLFEGVPLILHHLRRKSS